MALTQVQPGMLGTPQPNNFKNRLINGAMVIDQRNGGSVVTITTGQFPVDRFQAFASTDGVLTGQQSSTAPEGFTKSVVYTATTADASLGATQYAVSQQAIEGYNVADLGWGTASAKTVTLSFWARSSLTGTFGGSIANASNARSYPFLYTISSANTWTYCSVTIPGDTTGTWETTNQTGIKVYHGLGVGSTYSGTAGAWASANYLSATGGVSVISTLNATFYITGVQLEVGVTATGFDYRPYGTELMLCQRYYYKTNSLGTGAANSTTQFVTLISFPVQLRDTPSGGAAIVAGTSWVISDNYTADYTALSPTVLGNYSSTATCWRGALGGFTGLTTGRWYGGVPNPNSVIAFSAEL